MEYRIYDNQLNIVVEFTTFTPHFVYMLRQLDNPQDYILFKENDWFINLNDYLISNTEKMVML